jgi:predicted acyltransferase
VPLLTPASSRVVDMGGGYTWWLSILMFAAMTLCGSEMARLLSAAQPKGVRARNVALAGAGLLAAGWALVPVVPCIKHIYTVSFTAQAMGWCTLALAFLFWLTDMCHLRRGLGVFILFGQTALFAYLLKNVFGGTLNAFAHHVTKGLPRLIGAQAQPLAVWAASTALLIALLYVWRERKTYRAKAK